MSSDSLAVFRRNRGEDMRKLAEQHYQHDLTDTDRANLKTAASKFSTHAVVGSLIGLGLGAYLAFRLRQNRTRMYNAFRAAEKPTHVKFADGREVAIPDMTAYAKPSLLGDVATYTFFAGGGIFFGGELGAFSGAAAAKRSIGADGESKRRIAHAFQSFRVDVLRKQIELIEKEAGSDQKDLLEMDLST